MEYDDDCESCEKTHASLVVYLENCDLEDVTAMLGISPTSWQRYGELPSNPNRLQKPAACTAWMLESKNQTDSQDARRHIDWLLSQLSGKELAIRKLQMEGSVVKLWCYWLSKDGYGGPLLSPYQMKRLAELDIEIEFDFYS